jgi:methionine-rich copper-binding protein CopC
MARKILMLMALLGAAAVAHAHAHLVASVPADKSRIAAPAAVELKFNEAVKLTALTVQHGKDAAKPLTPLPARASATLSVPLPKLDAGDYVVAWRVAGDDGHIMSGKLGFTVDPAAAPASAQSAHDGANKDDHAQDHQHQH